MTDIIDKLAKQAGVSVDRMGYGEGNVGVLVELIVKECVGVIEAGALEAKTNFTFMGDDVPSCRHKTNILKHFGLLS